jgi:uncharacterized protein YfaS (alpha-2-macroglobulin family)
VRGGRSGSGGIQVDGVIAEPVQVREDFAATGFFLPHVTTGEDGAAVIEFRAPDTVTDWAVWVHALAPDLSSGSARRTISSRKELLVRPYLPRFLREGDRAVIKVLVDNLGPGRAGRKPAADLDG